MTEGEIIGWHHRLNVYELEQTLGVGGGQGSLTCCSPWGFKVSGMTEFLNLTELNCTLMSYLFLSLVGEFIKKQFLNSESFRGTSRKLN